MHYRPHVSAMVFGTHVALCLTRSVVVRKPVGRLCVGFRPQHPLASQVNASPRWHEKKIDNANKICKCINPERLFLIVAQRSLGLSCRRLRSGRSSTFSALVRQMLLIALLTKAQSCSSVEAVVLTVIADSNRNIHMAQSV